jgi:selenide,water dikinase
VLVGLERPDDAGVYKLSDDIAIVQTVDYITPIVDDAKTFGRIAAANALSDVWAMGARPVCALNIVCFPDDDMPIETLHDVLAGGMDALREAHVALVGGHSVSAPELKYGLAVTGTVRPDAYLTNLGAEAGDVLVVTKPLGTGVISTGVKGGMAEAAWVETATCSMTELNMVAGEIMLAHGPHACTDVTGFGLVGHAVEMIECSGVGLRLYAGRIPLLPGAAELARIGLLPAGLYRNREHYARHFVAETDVPRDVVDLLHDPQTSGGLLVALSPSSAGGFVAQIESRGGIAVAIGEFVRNHPGVVRVAP